MAMRCTSATWSRIVPDWKYSRCRRTKREQFAFKRPAPRCVMLAPANGFYATSGLGLDEVRIAFVLNVTAMRRSMEILKAGLEAYARRE